MNTETIQPASFIKRLAALLYDTFMIMAVLVVAAAVVILPVGMAFGYEIPAEDPFYQLYLLSVWGIFFCWFWVHGGQTIGMRAWRLHALRVNGEAMRWWDAILRFLAVLLLPLLLVSLGLYPVAVAFLSLNYLWPLVDKNNRTLHEILSQTRLLKSTRK